MSTQLSRRNFLKQASLAAGAVVLAACAPTAPAPQTAATQAPAAGPVTLTIWQSDWGKEYNDPMIKLSDAFTKDVMSNVKAEWTFLPKLTDKLSAAVAGGNVPDVAIIDDNYAVPRLGKVGGLIELSEYYSKDGIKAADFIPFTWKTVTYKDKVYGMPGGAGCQALMINKTIFKEVGIDADNLPDTPSWAQFTDWNQKVVKKDASGKLVRLGVNSTGFNAQYMGVLGFEYYNSDATKLACNSPKSIEAINKWKGLLPEGVKFEDISILLSSAPTAPSYASFGAGLQAIDNDGYWCFLVMDKYFKDFQYTLTKLPTPNGKKEEWSMYTGWVWNPTLPKGSKNAKEGWEFMKYGFWSHGEMLADTINWTSALARFPDFEKRTKTIIGDKSPTAVGLHHFSEMQYAGQYAIPFTMIDGQYRNAIGSAYDEIVRTGKSPQEAMDGVVATLQPELDKAIAAG